MDGAIIGTPHFMSPEQALGRSELIDERSDVYALGAMLYELLAGVRPYETVGERSTPHAVLTRLLAGPPRALAEVAPDAPPELVAIADKAMARNPSARYATMSALASELRAYLEGRVVAAYRTGAIEELAKWTRRNRGVATALATVLLVLLGGTAAIAALESVNARREHALAAEAADERRKAQQQAARADAQSTKARRLANDVLSLSAQKDLDDLVAEARELWPAHPEMIGRYVDWLRRADGLIEGRASDGAHGIEARPGLRDHRARLEELRRGSASWLPAFDDQERAWWERQLTKLVADLEQLQDPVAGLRSDVVAEPFGWGIPKRLAFARTIAERTVSGPNGARAWAEASARIAASPRYGGLVVTPQMGLLPIGPDPESGLWEFAHLQTGAPAVRDETSRLRITDETGLVFVLIPGGSFWMGAQSTDPHGHNYDPRAEPREGPVHDADVEPFFLSKYEMTQGQWLRLAGRNPSFYQPPSEHAPSLSHPVEQVTWWECLEVLDRLGLSLPTETQWEYGARAGTATPWWTGEQRESLRGRVNLADQTAREGGANFESIADWPDLEDGAFAHAAVGSYSANPFGLHEVSGNLWEWCLDAYLQYSDDGMEPRVPSPGIDVRTNRGGSFYDAASSARSSCRTSYAAESREFGLGLRPAREL